MPLRTCCVGRLTTVLCNAQVIARKYMATATVEGQWVLLQNTHLGLGYLTEVEQFLVKAEDLHEDFR